MEFHKLVRDNIPEIIKKQGKAVRVRVLEGDEYTRHLERKLDEEVQEFHADKNLEELADIMEVVYALAENLGASVDDLMEIYRRKHEARGGFRDRIFLISTEERL